MNREVLSAAHVSYLDILFCLEWQPANINNKCSKLPADTLVDIAKNPTKCFAGRLAVPVALLKQLGTRAVCKMEPFYENTSLR